MRLAKEAARDRAAPCPKAVDAAEKAREVQWRKVLASHEEETEAHLEAAARDKENAIRKVHRQGRGGIGRDEDAREKLKPYGGGGREGGGGGEGAGIELGEGGKEGGDAEGGDDE